jgi:sigma-B regulation protein RsbU (phosphoserine phosphatase)
VSLQNALLLRDRLAVARLEEELHLAQQIQQTFLRSDFPPLPRCEVHAVNLPSRQVGGDYYDVVQAPDGSFLVAIADVAGKGVPAALLSSMLQAALRTQARSVESPATILRNINSLVYRSTAVHQFATFFLARVSADGNRMAYANAGHNWPILLRRNGEREWLKCGGTILGIMEDVAMDEASLELHAGDLLVFYTDGISEATNSDGELYGEERLVEFVAGLPPALNPEAISASILREIERHLGRLEAQDDRTLVVLRVQETSREHVSRAPVSVEVVAG